MTATPATIAVHDLPAAPPSTPPLLVTVASIVVAVIGPVLAFVDPDGKISTPAVQAAVILGFLAAALGFYVVHLVAVTVHRYGWTKAAGVYVETAASAEIHALLPELQSSYAHAVPLLRSLPDYQTLAENVADLRQRVDNIPAAQAEAAKSVLLEALGQAPLHPAPPQPPPAPEPAGGVEVTPAVPPAT